MFYNQEVEDFINEFVKALRENNAAIFAGAGMSVNSGFFDWKKLLEPVAKKLGLDINEEYDLTALAQFFVDDKGGRGELNQILVEEFRKVNIKHTQNHEIIARLPISIYWTTNFDDLIEKALERVGKKADVKRNQDDLSINLPRRDAIVYKMHGDITDLSKTVLTKHDYEDYNKTRELFSNAFKADFVSRTMIFIGFSFTDPNLDYLISRIRAIQLGNKKPDYYFLREEENKQKLRRQVIRANSLKQYGLRPIWIKSYDDITGILEEVERRYLRSSIFMSGSANNYGSYFKSDEEARLFIQSLSQQLSANGYKIISGFGYNIGTYVINGVLNNMLEQGNKKIDSYISLRPFPLIGKNDEDSLKIKEKFRHDIVSEAGVAIFLFGNRIFNGNMVLSKGVESEFAIAESAGLKIIPIGITGYVAEQIWKRVIENFNNYYADHEDLKEDFKKLGNTEISIEEIIRTILKILNQLNQF